MKWMIFSKNGMLLGTFEKVEDAAEAFFRWPQAFRIHCSSACMER